MKFSTLSKVLFFALILASVNVFAQAPNGFNYQAIARNSSGNILASQSIKLRLTITNGNGGASLYQEVQSVTTNQFGLFTLNVGSISPSSFSSIQWSSKTPWLHVEMDPTG